MIGITVFVLSILFTLRFGDIVDTIQERNRQLLKASIRKRDGNK
jgi:hypothetical protein